MKYLQQQRFGSSFDSKTICLSSEFSDPFYLPQSIHTVVESYDTWDMEDFPGTSIEVEVFQIKVWNFDSPVVTWRENGKTDINFHNVEILILPPDDDAQVGEVVGIQSEGGRFLTTEVNPALFRNNLIADSQKDEGIEED